jgi:hypothetical protein
VSLLAAFSASIAVGIPAATAQHPTNFKPAPAVFSIKPEVLNEQVGPFTVTAPAFGNTLRRAGRGAFEPATFRQRLLVSQDSPDQVLDSRSAGIGYYDVYASGYLDGADVQVYRIVNGKVKLVREDIVAPGGSVIEAWKGIISDQKVIPADVTEAQYPLGRLEPPRFAALVHRVCRGPRRRALRRRHTGQTGIHNGQAQYPAEKQGYRLPPARQKLRPTARSH